MLQEQGRPPGERARCRSRDGAQSCVRATLSRGAVWPCARWSPHPCSEKRSKLSRTVTLSAGRALRRAASSAPLLQRSTRGGCSPGSLTLASAGCCNLARLMCRPFGTAGCLDASQAPTQGSGLTAGPDLPRLEDRRRPAPPRPTESRRRAPARRRAKLRPGPAPDHS